LLSDDLFPNLYNRIDCLGRQNLTYVIFRWFPQPVDRGVFLGHIDELPILSLRLEITLTGEAEDTGGSNPEWLGVRHPNHCTVLPQETRWWCC
jgi:hypothetical protein